MIQGELRIVKGSTKPFDIELFDDNDVVEDLSTATLATFVMRNELTGSNVLLLRTTDGNLAIDSGDSKLTGTLTQIQADALVAGVYIAEAAIRFGATDWIHTDPFYVRVLLSAAPHS